MVQLLNGKTNEEKHTTFFEYYEELNEKNKAEIRVKIANALKISRRSVYRRISENDFSPNELNKIWVATNICFCSRRGFFLDTNVSINETLKKYRLTF